MCQLTTKRGSLYPPEIYFNYLFIDTSVRELDLLQLSRRLGKLLKVLGILRESKKVHGDTTAAEFH